MQTFGIRSGNQKQNKPERSQQTTSIFPKPPLRSSLRAAAGCLCASAVKNSPVCGEKKLTCPGAEIVDALADVKGAKFGETGAGWVKTHFIDQLFKDQRVVSEQINAPFPVVKTGRAEITWVTRSMYFRPKCPWICASRRDARPLTCRTS